jgi:hypothetical protein
MALCELVINKDAGHLIGMLCSSKVDDNPWVRKAALQVLRPMCPPKFRPYLPKLDRCWARPDREAMAAALERGNLKPRRGRPPSLRFDPPKRMQPLKDYVPDLEEQLDELYRDNALGKCAIIRISE